ncbi:MAG TPA: hypothetical protein PK373_10960, partial [Sedimentisphaerales bacterium]|nr:hypothetical protein [Sedimentisphaerales bacterium]
MTKCCNNGNVKIDPTDPCHPPQVSCGSKATASGTPGCPLAWFERMIPNCLQYAQEAKAKGKRIVGIMCE